jgi:hypothetical protein
MFDVLIFCVTKGPTGHTMHTTALKVKLNLWLCLLKGHAVTAYRRSRRTAPRFLNFGSKWRLVHTFMAYTLVHHRNSRRWPSEMVRRVAEGKNLCPFPGIEIRFLGGPALSLSSITTNISRLKKKFGK